MWKQIYAILMEAPGALRGCLEPVKYVCTAAARFRKSVCLWTRSFILQGLQLVAGSGRVNVLPGVIMSA